MLHPIGRSYYLLFIARAQFLFVLAGDRPFSILGVNEIIRFAILFYKVPMARSLDLRPVQSNKDKKLALIEEIRAVAPKSTI